MKTSRRRRLARSVAVRPRLRPPTRTMSQRSPPPRRARRPQPPAPKTPPQRRVVVALRRPLLSPTLKTMPKSKLLRRRLEAVLASRSRLRRKSKKSTRSRLRQRERLGAVLASPWPPMSKTKSRLLRRRAVAVLSLSNRRLPTRPPPRRVEVALVSRSPLTRRSEPRSICGDLQIVCLAGGFPRSALSLHYVHAVESVLLLRSMYYYHVSTSAILYWSIWPATNTP
jgi:hypothetical protein